MDCPQSYVKYGALPRRDNERTVKKYSSLIQWKKHPKVLDLGCGDGTTTVEVLEPILPRSYVKLLGTDLQEKMVKFANDLKNKGDKVEFCQFDIAGEELLPERFDHVFSFFAFHWVADLKKGFQNVYDFLTPGGDMLINLLCEMPYYDILNKFINHPVWGSYIDKSMIPHFINGREIPENTIQNHLEEIGFSNIQIFIEKNTFVFPSWAHIFKLFLAVDPIIPKLTMDQKQDYIVEYYCELRNVMDLYEEQGQVVFKYNLLVAYASKSD